MPIIMEREYSIRSFEQCPECSTDCRLTKIAEALSSGPVTQQQIDKIVNEFGSMSYFDRRPVPNPNIPDSIHCFEKGKANGGVIILDQTPTPEVTS
jgi:hypothetical protein